MQNNNIYIQGQIDIFLSDPLSSQKIPISDLDYRISEGDYILIYLDDNQIPYIMRRQYFKNLIFENYDYICDDDNNIIKDKKYYNLENWFLNTEEKPNIIISKSQVDELINNENIYSFKLNTTNKELKTFPYFDYEFIKYMEQLNYRKKERKLNKIWRPLRQYTKTRYKPINSLLLRRNLKDEIFNISEYFRFDMYEPFKDIVMMFIDFYYFLNKEKNIQRKNDIDKIKNVIHGLDYLFYKHASYSDGNLIVYRGVNNSYPYLENVGDKTVLENYTSTSDSAYNILSKPVKYKIVVAKGIPYLDLTTKELSKYTEYPDEREILLPRNLVAELIKKGSDEEEFYNCYDNYCNNSVDSVDSKEYEHMDIIIVRPINSNQFDVLDKKSSLHTVYDISPYSV